MAAEEEAIAVEGGGGEYGEEVSAPEAGISIENAGEGAAVTTVPETPATPAQQLEELERRASELQAQRADLKMQLAAAVAAAASQLPPATPTGLPLPQEPDALVEELSVLHAARQYLQYLQELQALTRHAEKLTRSAERAFSEGDPDAYLRECSDAVNAFSHAMGYAIALEQMQEQGRVGSHALVHHGTGVIARVSASGTALKSMLSSAVQQALGQCAWPPPVLGTKAQEGETNSKTDWNGFEATNAAAFKTLQELFIIQITLQRAMDYKAFLSLGSNAGPLLWPSVELVAGIGAWLKHHFAQGLPTDRADRPEWLFAAAIKAAKLCAPAAEELQGSIDAHQLQQWYSLQLDTARAVGVAAVAPVLREHVLPRLVQLGDSAGWLHFVDEAAKFEAKMAPLSGTAAGIAAGEGVGESALAVAHPDSVLEVLFEQEEWVQGWLGAEREDAERQVDAAVEAADAWKAAAEMKSAVAELAGLGLGAAPAAATGAEAALDGLGASQASHHEFYPPICAETVLALVTALARRQNCLFAPEHKGRFTQEVVLPALKIFRARLGAMLVRMEQFSHLVDSTGLSKVGAAICAAHFMGHSLLEPSGELLTAIAGDDELSAAMEKEAGALASFRRQWGYKLAKLAVEKFQSGFTAYRKRLAAFSTSSEQPISGHGHTPQGPSPSLLPAADGLQTLLHAMASHLDAVVFRDVWRAVAVAVNSAFFNDVATEATFTFEGAVQLEYDLDALIGVFGGCTSRPAAHFKESKEACRLLKLGQEEAAKLMAAVQSGGGEAQASVAAAGLKALNAEQARSVLSQRADFLL